MNVYRIEGQEYVADSAEQAYAEHMVGWRVAQFKDGFVPAVPVLVATVPKDVTVHVPGVRSAGIFSGIADLVIEAPKPDPYAYWDCDDGAEQLTHESAEEAIYAHLNGLAPEYWPEMLTVYPYRRFAIEAYVQPERLASDILETLLERLDLDHELGNPNEATEPTQDMKSLAETFVRGIIEKYPVWSCEAVLGAELTVNVAEWVRANAAEWLDELDVLAALERLEAK